MNKYASAMGGSQVSSTINALKNVNGLQFKEVFSAEQISSAVKKTVPEYRSRAFSP